MTGTPPANTGKWANAALNTTLVQALKAPTLKKRRADPGHARPEPWVWRGSVGKKGTVISVWAQARRNGWCRLDHAAGVTAVEPRQTPRFKEQGVHN
jgi:hypothetical protein